MSRLVWVNNPCGIRRGGSKWYGSIDGSEGVDDAFVVFQTPVAGFRAAARVLWSYQENHRVRTLRALISRWAPEGENDEARYLAFVVGELGIGPDEVLRLTDHLPGLLYAISCYETGGGWYCWEDLHAGIKFAGSEAPRWWRRY